MWCVFWAPIRSNVFQLSSKKEEKESSQESGKDMDIDDGGPIQSYSWISILNPRKRFYVCTVLFIIGKTQKSMITTLFSPSLCYFIIQNTFFFFFSFVGNSIWEIWKKCNSSFTKEVLTLKFWQNFVKNCYNAMCWWVSQGQSHIKK